jgi:RNA polymerase sigma-70 factor (ECF subfamily)
MTEPPVAGKAALYLLVLRCQAGDERAFARLMDAFGQKTLGYLRGLIGDDADDVHQELWLGVYRTLGSLADPGAFRTWLFRSTRHRAIDALRRRKREREMIDETPIDRTVADPESGDDDDDVLDEAALELALGALPAPQREVLVLRYRDELSYAEIALVVGCPIGTVRTRLHHAKRRLSELLKRGFA